MKTCNIVFCTLFVSILFYSCDKNESAPEIADQEFSIEENSPAGTIIGAIEADDADDGQVISFEIIDGNDRGLFEIEPDSGILKVKNPNELDYEQYQSFALDIAVSDNHEKEPLESTASIQINLTDANEYAPEMNNQNFTMDENPANGLEIGKMLAIDEDIHQDLIFSIIDPKQEGYFTIHPQTGLLSVNDSTGFDYELNQKMSVSIRVQDDHAESLDDTAVVEITLQNIHELTDGLVACYLFDGNAMNMVEDNNHGIDSDVQYVSDRSGNAASSCYFNGSCSYITIPHTDELSYDARTESFSIALWIKSPDPTHGTDQSGLLIYKWDSKLATPYPYTFWGLTESLKTPVFASSAERLTCQLDGLWDDQWHQVVVVFDHTLQQMSVYLDGQFVESNIHQFTTSTYNDKDIFIGGVPFVDRYYSGSIDDVYFFNRALSAEEAAALYHK